MQCYWLFNLYHLQKIGLCTYFMLNILDILSPCFIPFQVPFYCKQVYPPNNFSSKFSIENFLHFRHWWPCTKPWFPLFSTAWLISIIRRRVSLTLKACYHFVFTMAGVKKKSQGKWNIFVVSNSGLRTTGRKRVTSTRAIRMEPYKA